MERKTRFGIYAAYVYLLLPFIIFAVGWLKTWIAIPVLIALAFSFYKMLCHAPSLWRPEFTRDNVEKIIVIIGIICLWIYLSGIGKVVFQNTDHTARNAIFDILVENDWPVIGTAADGKTTTGLIYYIGFWLPSAIVGKIFGVQAGYHMQMVWAALGIVLVYYFICARTKKLEIWPLIVFVLFSGLDYLGYYILGTDMSTISSTMHLEWWNDPYQFSGITTQLFWVFNQCIPAWLATMLVMNQKSNKSNVIILASSMLTSTLPFIGLIPIVLYFIFQTVYKNKGNRLQIFRNDVLTFQNVVGGGIIGVLSFLYLVGNFSGRAIGTSQQPIVEGKFEGSLILWILCIAIEIGLYLVLVYRKEKNNKLFFLIAVELCVFPLIRVGTSNDFCMRAIIPAQIILILFVIDSLREAVTKKKRGMIFTFIIVLGTGSITPIHEINRTFTETVQRQRNGVQVEEGTVDIEAFLNPGNFAGEIDNSVFYKYFTK